MCYVNKNVLEPWLMCDPCESFSGIMGQSREMELMKIQTIA
jgi:hypothetical protein